MEPRSMWAQGITIIIGVWLLASPDIMGYGGPARANNQIVGVWMTTFGMIAISECLRAVRWANFALGVWLILAPFVLDYLDGQASDSLVVGLAAMSLALVRGSMSERFGGGWSALWRKPRTMTKIVERDYDHVETTSPRERTRADEASAAGTAG